MKGFEKIYWLGGSPCCGKSSVAERLSRCFGLHYYKCDDHFGRHLAVAASRGLPMSSVVARSTHEYVFMRSDAENLRLPFDLYNEHLDLIFADISSLPRPLLVEGCALLPERLKAAGVPPDRAHYLVPEELFFRAEYKKRTWAQDRLQETSDPARAFANWMNRDVAFARVISDMARAAGFPCTQVDGRVTCVETATAIARHFALLP
jgi:hypothetical protein